MHIPVGYTSIEINLGCTAMGFSSSDIDLVYTAIGYTTSDKDLVYSAVGSVTIESNYGNRVPKTKIRRKPDSFELVYTKL